MHGNVWEWCQDWHGDYPSGAVTDPTGASSGSYRVLRGGSWGRNSGDCRSAFRLRLTPDRRNSLNGFRVLRSSVK
jgi:sulfatase modifying factor 1